MRLHADAGFLPTVGPATRNCDRRLQAGVTLIEMLLVVLLISLMIGVTVPAFQAGLPTIRLRSASSSIAQFLRQASTQVEKQQVPVLLLVDPAGRRLDYRDASGAVSEEISLPDGIEISAIFPSAIGAVPGPREFLFYPGGAPPAVADRCRCAPSATRSSC